jgi:hypothetical protein
MGAHRFLAVGAVPLTVALLSGCHLVFGLDKLTYEDTGGGGAGGGGGTGGTGGTTTIDPGCIPSQTPNAVRDDCGVFVSSSTGDDSPESDGSQAKPFATIGKALGSAKSGPIYLCAETFTEAVQLKAGATIYGGLDCASGEWTWIGPTKKSEISPEAGLVALVLDPGVAATVEDVTLRAKDAVEAGGSSIAVIATSGAELDLARCDVETGNGKDGAAGDAFAMSAAPGGMGNAGMDACSGPMIFGGGSVTNSCDEADPNDSISGSGGIGQEAIGGAGSPGTPLGTMNGGTGQLDDAGMCTSGAAGDDGTAGTPGTGAQGTGTITAQGYAGPAANPGDKGKPGQGGGGGGGAKGGTGAGKCADMASAGGASGGSGGSGGCGGAGGKGGQAGGASIGIVSLGATLVFADVKITTKNGGKGGDGGAGQLGGMGGPAGAGGSKASAASLKDGCSGGPGGKGGAGGKGGGGAGGPSIGIAHTGEAPDIKSATTSLGTPGSGGAGEGDTGSGAPGLAEVTRSFL